MTRHSQTRGRLFMERASNTALLAVGAVLVWSIFSPDPVPLTPEPPPEEQVEAPQTEAEEEMQDVQEQALAIALPPPPHAPAQAVQPATAPPNPQPAPQPDPQMAPQMATEAIQEVVREVAAPQPAPTPAPAPVVTPTPPVRTIAALQPSEPVQPAPRPVLALQPTPAPVEPPPPVTIEALSVTPDPVVETPEPIVVAALTPSPVEPPPEYADPITVEPLTIEPIQPVEIPPLEVPADPVSDPVEVADPDQESESEPTRQDAPPPPPQQSEAPVDVPPTTPAAPPIEEVQVAVNTPEGAQTERQGRALLRLMEMDAGPDLRIAWPAAAGDRERLYRVLSSCYGMQSVLMNGQGGIFLAEGPAGQATAPDVARYSGFVRAAEGAIPALERTALRPIYRHHGLSDRAAQIVRLFPRRADALLLGGLSQLLEGGLSKGNQVEALYTLTNQGLAIVDIRQNGRPVDGRVVIAPIHSCGGLV